MPSVSASQQRFFGMCEHNPEHANGTCPDMPKAKMHEFAATKRKGLPEHVSGRRKPKPSYPMPMKGGK